MMDTDWLKVYDHYRNKEGSVVNARPVVIQMMMRDEYLTKEQAQDKLNKLINDRIAAEAMTYDK